MGHFETVHKIHAKETVRKSNIGKLLGCSPLVIGHGIKIKKHPKHRPGTVFLKMLKNWLKLYEKYACKNIVKSYKKSRLGQNSGKSKCFTLEMRRFQ